MQIVVRLGFLWVGFLQILIRYTMNHTMRFLCPEASILLGLLHPLVSSSTVLLNPEKP